MIVTWATNKIGVYASTLSLKFNLTVEHGVTGFILCYLFELVFLN